MDNKIKHYSITQTIPNEEFLPLLRGEAPYYANLNRPAQSAYSFATDIARIQSWGGTISILSPDQSHQFVLYEIARITDSETLVAATSTDDVNSRYGIVVAEAEFDPASGLYINVVICTFCPNFIYPSISAPSGSAGTVLYLDLTDLKHLSNTHTSSTGYITDRKLAVKTGPHSIFFSGTANIFGA